MKFVQTTDNNGHISIDTIVTYLSWYFDSIIWSVFFLFWCAVAGFLRNFIVFIGEQEWPVTADQLNGSSFTQCGQYEGIPPRGATVTVKCTPSSIFGHYVYIHQPTSEWRMNVCEVEVYSGEWLHEIHSFSYHKKHNNFTFIRDKVDDWTVEWNCIYSPNFTKS